MIDIRKLKELVRLMVENDLTELDLRDSEEQVTVRRPTLYGAAPLATAPPPLHAGLTLSPAALPASGKGAGAALAIEEEPGTIRIESPMVGTLYLAPNPDASPFVSVGTPVTPETVVCILEAMKIFNEIKAECTGTIAKVLAKSGQAVEFGQPLFSVKPA